MRLLPCIVQARSLWLPVFLLAVCGILAFPALAQQAVRARKTMITSSLPPCPASFIKAALAASDGTLWIATENDGLLRLPLSGPWLRIREEKGFPSTLNFTSLAEDGEGRIWAGTGNQGVAVWNGKTWQTYNQKNALLGEHVYDIQVSAANGDIAIATSGGLSIYQPSQKTWKDVTRAHGLPEDQIQSLSFSPSGILWAAFSCGGIASSPPKNGYTNWKIWQAPWYREKDQRIRQPLQEYGEGLPSNLCNAIIAPADSSIWAGTSSGLAWTTNGRNWKFVRGRDCQAKNKGLFGGPRINRNQLASSAMPVPDLIPEDYITALHSSPHGLWIGFRQKGACLIDPTTLKNIPSVNKQPIRRGNHHQDLWVTCFVTMPDGMTYAGTYGNGLIPLLQSPPSPRQSRIFCEIPLHPPTPPVPTPSSLQTMVAGIKASPQPPKPGRAIFWFEDWATQGDWCQRYGQRFAVLCAANAPIGNMRYFFDTRSDEDTYLYSVGGTMGPHKKDNDLLRHWVHWVNKPDNRNVLYCPTDATRTEAEWDDHGEVYSRTFDGPDIWAIARVPEGTQTISLYFFNPNGREKNNGQRDYLIEVRSWKSRLPAAVITRVRSPDKYGLPEDCREQELKDVLKAPVQARCRVTDFAGGGVYKTFIVEGPGTFYIRVCRNYSMNTILNGVFLSRYLEPSYKPFSCLATAGGYPEPPDLRNFAPESLAGPHMDLWTRAFVHGSDSPSSIHKTRPLLLYAYRAAAHHPAVSSSLLKNWRWHLKLWTPEDKEHFASFMYRSWSRKQDLYSFYRSREWCPNSPDVIDFTMDEVDILESQKINWRQFIPNSPDYLESNFRAMKQQVRQWSAEFKLKKQKKKKN